MLKQLSYGLYPKGNKRTWLKYQLCSISALCTVWVLLIEWLIEFPQWPWFGRHHYTNFIDGKNGLWSSLRPQVGGLGLKTTLTFPLHLPGSKSGENGDVTVGIGEYFTFQQVLEQRVQYCIHTDERGGRRFIGEKHNKYTKENLPVECKSWSYEEQR